MENVSSTVATPESGETRPLEGGEYDEGRGRSVSGQALTPMENVSSTVAAPESGETCPYSVI